jgi:thioesterase domain-containing protein/acyl carrier protein
VVFSEGTLSEEIAERIAADGRDVITVTPGAEFSATGRHYVIDLRNPEDYSKLFLDLEKEGRLPERIVHAWWLDGEEKPVATEPLEDYELQGLHSLGVLAQSIAGMELKRPIKIDVLCSDIEDVIGTEDLDTRRATLAGACRAIPDAYPNVETRLIDVAVQEIPRAQLISQIVSELSRDGSESVVAYRWGVRWAKSYEGLRIGGSTEGPDSPIRKGNYLIVGFNDEIGLALADHLVDTFGCSVVTVQQLSDPDGANHEQIEGAESISPQAGENGRGEKVVVFKTDLTDKAQLARVVALASRYAGRFDGLIVYQADGTYPAERLGADPLAWSKAVLPDLMSLFGLERLIAEGELDFCLVLSPLESACGYGAILSSAKASARDTVAARQSRRRSGSWISARIDLPALIEAPDDVNSDQSSITLAEWLEAVTYLLAFEQASQIAICPAGIEPRRRSPGGESLGASSETPVQNPPNLYPRPELQNAYVAPRTDDERKIAQVWEHLLGIESVGIHDDFFELGGHSLIAIQLIMDLRKELDVDIHLGSLFEAPTVGGLARCMADIRRGSPALPSIIAPLQPLGSKPPLFAVHPIGGDAFVFRDLARELAPDQPFYALQSLGLVETVTIGDGFERIEDMSAHYVECIRAVQPTGPVFLSGSSWGGIVAFEMAQQLARSGQEVALLALFDTPAPKTIAKAQNTPDEIILLALARERGRQYKSEVPLTIEDLADLTLDEQLTLIIEQLKIAKLAPPELTMEWCRNFIRGYRYRIGLTVLYEPELYPGKISFFRASLRDEVIRPQIEALNMDFLDPTLGWSELTSQPVDIYVVEGFHENILQSPQIGTAVRESIERATTALAGAARQPSVLDAVTLVAGE